MGKVSVPVGRSHVEPPEKITIDLATSLADLVMRIHKENNVLFLAVVTDQNWPSAS
ncbi:MAG: hypothetical protein GY713_01720 [Actinomycetia bacterium]|nr:hypothetical protein [Actinomycetes bacterium]